MADGTGVTDVDSLAAEDDWAVEGDADDAPPTDEDGTDEDGTAERDLVLVRVGLSNGDPLDEVDALGGTDDFDGLGRVGVGRAEVGAG